MSTDTLRLAIVITVLVGAAGYLVQAYTSARRAEQSAMVQTREMHLAEQSRQREHQMMLAQFQELKKMSWGDDRLLSKRDAKDMRNSGSYLGVTDTVNTRWAKETMLVAEASTTGFDASLFLSVGRIGEGESLVGEHLDGLIPHEIVVFIIIRSYANSCCVLLRDCDHRLAVPDADHQSSQ